jgi:hypothetical protein
MKVAAECQFFVVSSTEQCMIVPTQLCAENQKHGGAMGMMFAVEQMPDTYGLPVYKTTKTIEERVGDEVHILCGYEMFGQTIWTHIAIMTARDLAEASNKCHQIATRPARQMIRMGG